MLRLRQAASLRPLPAWLVEAGLVLLVGGLLLLAMRGSTEANSRPVDALAYALGLGQAAALLARHRWPRTVLVAAGGLQQTYLMLDYPAFSAALPLAIPFYSVVISGHLRFAIGLAALLVGGQTLGRLFEGDAPYPVFVGAFYEAALLALLLSLGEVVRSRRAWQAEVHARMQRSEEDARRESRRRVTEERLRIARDIHDVVAHTISVVVVQSSLAADVLDHNPQQAREALRTIRDASRDALNELRSTIGVLRSGDATEDGPRPLVPGLDQVQTLVDAAAASGLRVDVERLGEPRPLPAAVDQTAYRIVQEALTNVLRHARASLARVSICYEPDGLALEVIDDGSAAPATARSAPPGHGLIGMGERAAALGGTLQAGRSEQGGFQVRARLPLSPSAALVAANGKLDVA
jgi:signal transduction histidine kinase